MGHDATKVLLGCVQSSVREVFSRAGLIAAGKNVRLKSDGTITTAAADGAALGISLGTSMSDISQTAICTKGLRVPLICTSGYNPVIGSQVNIDDVTGHAKAAGGGVTAMNAVYGSRELTAIDEVGTTNALKCALIDYPGGL